MTVVESRQPIDGDASTPAPLAPWERRRLNHYISRERAVLKRNFIARANAIYLEVLDLQYEAQGLVVAGIVDAAVRNSISVARGFAGRAVRLSRPSEQSDN